MIPQISLLSLALALAVPPMVASGPTLAPQQEASVDLEELAEGVYLFTYNVHRSLFVVGEDAVMVTDPQSPAAAERYLEAVREVTDRPIRYLVYSHHHADHVSGADVFGDDVTIVAHRNVLPHLDGSGVVPPDLVFARETVLRLGGIDVNLVYPGPSETDSNIIAWVPGREVAFMVDAVAVRTLPWRDLGGADPIEWIESLEDLHDLDFEILAPGHGPTGTRESVREFIGYMQALVNAVSRRMDRGESLSEIQATLELPGYSDWVRYDEHFELNIEGVYEGLQRRGGSTAR